MKGPQAPTDPARAGTQALAAGTAPASLALRAAILDLLARRGAGKSICPSEVARAVRADWRPLMGSVRAEAAAMVTEGLIEVTQKGVVVAPETARGPIRLRLPQDGSGALPPAY